MKYRALILLAGGLLLRTSLLPAAFDADERAQAGVVPEAMRRSLAANFPGLALPNEGDLSGPWSDFQTRYAWLPYLTSGDFNEDGLKDYAALLVGDTQWKFVIFQGTGDGGYEPQTIRSGDIPGNGYVRYPKALRLRMIPKGQPYNPEGGDGLASFTLRHDCIELHDDNRGTWLFQFANGRYTDFQWKEGFSLGYGGN